MKELTIEEKIAEIKSTNTYQDVKNAWFPPYHEKEYYFVSYSHKDYKLVYESLYRLQSGEKRLNLWYDHNLTPGRDWEIEARRYIYDFNCKGVIFFVSENAVLSQSIHKEIEFVKNSGKSYLSINLPCEKIKGHIGEYLSAAKMLELLKQQGGEIEDYEEKSAVLSETFNDKITFLPLNEDIDSQITKILSLNRQPLLVVGNNETDIIKQPAIVAINDLNVEEIKEDDFILLDKKGKPLFLTVIDDCAFANCYHLKKVSLPNNITTIGEFSFYNCKSLIEIKMPENCFFIGNRAFMGCLNLLNFIISDNIEYIGDLTFYGCLNLASIYVSKANKKYSSQDGVLYNKSKTKFIHVPNALTGAISIPNNIVKINNEFNRNSKITSITLGKKVKVIGEQAFLMCTNLHKIDIDENVNTIGDSAFNGCISLADITLPNTVTSVGKYAFSGCTSLENIFIGKNIKSIHTATFAFCINLKNITIPKSVTSISFFSFKDCKNLQDIFYDGTRQQWQEIKKDKNWDYGTPDYTVHCTDGDFKKGEFET